MVLLWGRDPQRFHLAIVQQPGAPDGPRCPEIISGQREGFAYQGAKLYNTL